MSVCSLELAQRLAKFGIKQEAEHYWFYDDDDDEPCWRVAHQSDPRIYFTEIYAAFNPQELCDLLGNQVLVKKYCSRQSFFSTMEIWDVTYDNFRVQEIDTLPNALAKMVMHARVKELINPPNIQPTSPSRELS